MCFLTDCLCCTINTNRCSQRIYICHRMSHNQNISTGHHILTKSFRLNTRLNTRVLIAHFPLATIIGNTVTILDNCLIATSGKCLIDSHTGVVITLWIRVAAESQTHTECSRNLVAHTDRLHIFQQWETIFFQFLEIFLLHYNKILICLDLFDNTINLHEILVNLSIDQCQQQTLTNLFHTLDHFVIIVNIKHTGNQSLFFIGTDIFITFRYILHMHCNKVLLLFRHLHQLLRIAKSFYRYLS